LAAALHAVSLLTHQRLLAEVVGRGYRATRSWLTEGRGRLPDPERSLPLHHHRRRNGGIQPDCPPQQPPPQQPPEGVGAGAGTGPLAPRATANADSNLTVSTCPSGQRALSLAADMGRATSNVDPHSRQRKS
jgi:hypothetical protein